MKKHFYFLLMAALVCGLSLSVTSCKDDDKNDDNGGGESGENLGPQNEQNEVATKFWSVVGELVDMDEFTEDYKSATFEPTIGVEDPTDPQARVVYTNSAAAAAERFANLVNIDGITEETTTKSWSDSEVGTLTYTKVTDGTAWATVDVKIKQVPHLTKIIYREPSQTDENGGVKGNAAAYYRFGDIIWRNNANNQKEYWICVRPAFDPEGKGDSHWVSISPVPKKNQWSWTYENKKKGVKRTYVLPTGLKENEEHMQNFAEMLFAIFHPKIWNNNVTRWASTDKKGNPKGLKIFHDFHSDKVKYHNMFFWQNVRNAWSNPQFELPYDRGEICKTVFGMSFEELKENFDNNGLYLLYKGYSWVKGNAPTLYQAHYVNGTKINELNMQTPNPLLQVKAAVYNSSDPKLDIEFNIATECTLEKPYIVNEKFFGDTYPRFIIRHATGAELNKKGSYDNRKPMNGVYQVYRYYTEHINSTNKPEETEGNEADVYAN